MAKKKKKEKQYYQYVDSVLSGKQIAGELIILACKRFNELKANPKYQFDEKAVDNVIDFVGILKHFVGKSAGQSFKLEAWEQFIIANIYGFKIKKTGKRLVRNVYWEIARKNGKSSLAAAICLYQLIADGEASANVFFVANTKEQAKIAFDMCRNFCGTIDENNKYLIPYRDKITLEKTNSFLKVLASDAANNLGYNASAYLYDEFAKVKNVDLKNALATSMGMRSQPLGIIITSAGSDKLGACYALRTTAIDILNGLKSDDSFASFIFSLDENDDWTDKKNWIKCNPNLNITVTEEFLESEVLRAKNSSIDEIDVKTYNFYMWVDSANVWIPDNYIVSASKNIDLKDYKGQEVYLGIDLSSTSDLTCVSYLIPQNNDKYIFKTQYYLPESCLLNKRLSGLYQQYYNNKQLILTPGNVVDYDAILTDILAVREYLNVQAVSYDSWNSTQFVINATEKGLPMMPFSQSIGNFNRPTKELERLILKGNVIIDNNQLTRFCFKNVFIMTDRNGNYKASKKYRSSDAKIDGVISMIQALGIYLSTPHYSYSLY